MTKQKQGKFSIGTKGAVYIGLQLGCSVNTVYQALRGITETELADNIRTMATERFVLPKGRRKAVLRDEYRQV